MFSHNFQIIYSVSIKPSKFPQNSFLKILWSFIEQKPAGENRNTWNSTHFFFTQIVSMSFSQKLNTDSRFSGFCRKILNRKISPTTSRIFLDFSDTQDLRCHLKPRRPFCRNIRFDDLSLDRRDRDQRILRRGRRRRCCWKCHIRALRRIAIVPNRGVEVKRRMRCRAFSQIRTRRCLCWVITSTWIT